MIFSSHTINLLAQVNNVDKYSYKYSKVVDTPATPDINKKTNLSELEAGEDYSMRSNWSRSSSPPPNPELIQVNECRLSYFSETKSSHMYKLSG